MFPLTPRWPSGPIARIVWMRSPEGCRCSRRRESPGRSFALPELRMAVDEANQQVGNGLVVGGRWVVVAARHCQPVHGNKVDPDLAGRLQEFEDLANLGLNFSIRPVRGHQNEKRVRVCGAQLLDEPDVSRFE